MIFEFEDYTVDVCVEKMKSLADKSSDANVLPAGFSESIQALSPLM